MSVTSRIALGIRIVALLALIHSSGCAKNRNKSVIVSDNRPIIEGASTIDQPTVVVNKPVVGTRFIDRHPMFYKPGEYYSTSDGNMVVRGARATFIGVPAGFVGEIKQAFRGVPKTVIIQ